MSDSKPVDFNYGPGMKDFMDGVKETLVQQGDFGGIGGHGAADHGGHGTHSQVSMKIGETVVNFRESTDVSKLY